MMAKINFLQSLLQSSVSWSFGNYYKCWFGAEETFILLSMLQTVFAA